jgi:hypothetical protein
MYDFLSKFVPKHPAICRLSAEKPKPTARKEPCKIEVNGLLVRTCDIYGHFYRNGVCFRCGKPSSPSHQTELDMQSRYSSLKGFCVHLNAMQLSFTRTEVGLLGEVGLDFGVLKGKLKGIRKKYG